MSQNTGNKSLSQWIWLLRNISTSVSIRDLSFFWSLSSLPSPLGGRGNVTGECYKQIWDLLERSEQGQEIDSGKAEEWKIWEDREQKMKRWKWIKRPYSFREASLFQALFGITFQRKGRSERWKRSESSLIMKSCSLSLRRKLEEDQLSWKKS